METSLSTTLSQVSTLAPSVSVNEEADPPTITVQINGKSSTANLPSRGDESFGSWIPYTGTIEDLQTDVDFPIYSKIFNQDIVIDFNTGYNPASRIIFDGATSNQVSVNHSANDQIFIPKNSIFNRPSTRSTLQFSWINGVAQITDDRADLHIHSLGSINEKIEVDLFYVRITDRVTTNAPLSAGQYRIWVRN